MFIPQLASFAASVRLFFGVLCFLLACAVLGVTAENAEVFDGISVGVGGVRMLFIEPMMAFAIGSNLGLALVMNGTKHMTILVN